MSKKTTIRKNPKNPNIKNRIICGNGEFADVRADSMFILDDYQRVQGGLEAWAKVWDWNFCGTLVVCQVGEKFHIVDGGGRHGAMGIVYPGYKINGKPIWLRCQVVTDKVANFLAHNDGTPVSPNIKFKVRKHNGDQPEVFIYKTLQAAGIKIRWESQGRSRLGTTSNPAAFLQIWKAVKSNRAEFKQVISWFVDHFSRPDGTIVEEAALTADFIKGFAWFLNNAEYSMEEIGIALRYNLMPASEIVKRGRAAAVNGYSRWKEVGNVLLTLVRLAMMAEAA